MNIENQVNLMGRLTKNNELKAWNNQNGAGFILKNTIVVNRKNKEEEPNYFDFTAWGKTAQFLAQWTRQGDKIAIFGELSQNKWQDEQGNSKYSISINVENAKIIAIAESNKAQSNQKEAQEQTPAQEQAQEQKQAPAQADNEDLNF